MGHLRSLTVSHDLFSVLNQIEKIRLEMMERLVVDQFGTTNETQWLEYSPKVTSLQMYPLWGKASLRTCRGGAWNLYAGSSRIGKSLAYSSDRSSNSIGFRVMRAI